MNQREKIALWLILGAGIIIKGLYLFWGMENPESVSALSIDSRYHYNWAVFISQGDLLANSPYFRAPLYPLWLGAVFKFSGGSLLFARVAQLIGGCLTLLLIFKIGLKLTNYKAATVAALLYLLYPISTFFEAELLLDWLFVLLALASFYFIFYGKSNLHKLLIGGLLFGLAAITRPTILILIIPVLIYFLQGFRDIKLRKKTVTNCAKFALVVVLTIAPVTAINFLGSGQLIPVSYQGGINFYIGNNSSSDGMTAALPPFGKDWTIEEADWLQYQQTGKRLKYSEQSSFWMSKTIGEIVDQPGQFLSLLAKKSYYLISGNEISNNRPLQEAVFGNHILRLLPVRFSLLLSLAIIPFFISRELRRKLYPILFAVLIYGITLTLFFISSRFRLPLIPFLAIAGGVGLVELFKIFKEKRFPRRLFVIFGSAVALFLVSNMNLFGANLHNQNQSLFLRGNQAIRSGDYENAAQIFEELRRLEPGYKNAALNAGIAYLKMGRVDDAINRFHAELAQHPSSADALGNIGSLFYIKHINDSALSYYVSALRSQPYHLMSALGLLSLPPGTVCDQHTEPQEELRHSIRRFFLENPAYLFAEAVYFSAMKRNDEAINNHLKVLELLRLSNTQVSFETSYSHLRATDPLWLKAQAAYQLGFLYGLTSKYDRSIIYSRLAIETNPNLSAAYVNLKSAYLMTGDQKRADSIAKIIERQ